MEHSPSWEANSSSASQEIPHIVKEGGEGQSTQLM
jgi:hypothetical protein